MKFDEIKGEFIKDIDKLLKNSESADELTEIVNGSFNFAIGLIRANLGIIGKGEGLKGAQEALEKVIDTLDQPGFIVEVPGA